MPTDDHRDRVPRDRWGRYAVVLLIEGSFMTEDPGAAQYIAAELPKMRRFQKALFAHDSAGGAATFSVEVPVARSAEAAIGEARDALDNLVWSAVRTPGEYLIKPLKVEWLSDA